MRKRATGRIENRQPRSTGRLSKMGRRLVIAAGLLLIAGVVHGTLTGWGAADSRWADADETSESEVSPEFPRSPLDDVAHGFWTFADVPVDLAIRQVGSAELREQLQEPPGVGFSLGDPAPLDASLLAVVQSRLELLSRTGPDSVYGLSLDGIEARLFVRQESTANYLLGGYLAYLTTPAEWTLLMAGPSAAAGRAEKLAEDLLPLPPGARRVCHRYSGEGRLQCQVVTVGNRYEQARRDWRAAGWSVQRPEWAQSHGDILFCERGDALVQVTGLGRPTPDNTVLVLVSVPAFERSED